MGIIKTSRTKNTSRNIAFGLIYKILNIILPFIARTVMIYTLGTKFLGLNSLFTSILQVLNLAELGFSNAIVYSMYKPIAENNKEKICGLLNYYKQVYRIIGGIILIAGIILLPFIGNFIEGEHPEGINIYIIYIINLANTCLTYFLFAYKSSLLIASQREDIISKVSSYTLIIQNIFQIAILFAIKNYYCYILILPLTTLINNLIISLIVNKSFPELKNNKHLKIDEEENSAIKKNIKGMFLQKIGGVVLSNVDFIVISAFLGLTTLAIYTNYYYIITSIFAILAVINNSLKSSVGNSIILETKEKNFRDFRKFNFIYLWIVSFCTIALVCLYQNFIYIWVGNTMMLPMNMVYLFAIYFFIHKWCDMLYVYQEACGLWWENRYVPIIAALVNLVLNIILVKTIGLPGILISTIVSVLFIYDIGYAIILFKHYFNKQQFRIWLKNQLQYLITTTIVAVITLLICNKLVTEKSINDLIIRGIICVFIPNFLLILAYHRKVEFKESLVMLKNILKIFKKTIKNKIEDKRTNIIHVEEFCNKEINKLCMLNKNAFLKEVEKISIPEAVGNFKWVGAVRYQNKMYCIPNSINSFLIYDLKQKIYTSIYDEEDNSPFMWTGGCEYNGMIYGFPRAANTLICLNPKENSIKKYNLGLNYKKEHHYGGVCLENGIVYQPPRNSNHILMIDLNKKRAKKLYILPKLLDVKYRYTSGILHPNGNIYFFPEQNEKIMVLNTKTRKISFIGERIDTMVFDAAIGIDGNIYGFSELKEGILKIEVAQNNAKMIHKEIGIPGCYGTKLGINGKIYGIPGNGDTIYEYDYIKDVVNEIDTLNEEIRAKCAGGIITEDGTIYTVPALGQTIYKYSFDDVQKKIDKDLLESIYYKDNY